MTMDWQGTCMGIIIYMWNTMMTRWLSHPVLRPKPDAQCMYAQDQVVMHTARMLIQKTNVFII
jgi:hypothetical protein